MSTRPTRSCIIVSRRERPRAADIRAQSPGSHPRTSRGMSEHDGDRDARLPSARHARRARRGARAGRARACVVLASAPSPVVDKIVGGPTILGRWAAQARIWPIALRSIYLAA